MSPSELLAQIPTPPPELFGLDLHTVELLGGGLLVVAAASAALALRARARRRAEAPPPTPELPGAAAGAAGDRPERGRGPRPRGGRRRPLPRRGPRPRAAGTSREGPRRGRGRRARPAGGGGPRAQGARGGGQARGVPGEEGGRGGGPRAPGPRGGRGAPAPRGGGRPGPARPPRRERLRAEEEARARAEAEAGRTLAAGLERTRGEGFMARLNGLFSRGAAVDDGVLAQLEEILFSADIGVRTASELVDTARDRLKRRELGDVGRVKGLIRSEVERMVSLPRPASLQGGGPPHVTMVVGVNGAGKTTTIGKLAARLTRQGKKVVIAAGDTFRAAATEQLDVWAERAHATLVRGPDGSDPGAVVFDAVKRALAEGADAVLVDTAGRLHTKTPLMEELKKVKRVLGKALPGAPHEVLLVLDATVGQNAIAQAKQFQEAVGVTGIALTKLDGTAKGGVVIGISDELKIPVTWVGVGEKVADLRPFDPHEFVEALFEAA